MANIPCPVPYDKFFETLSKHGLTAEHADRAQLAIEGRSVPLRTHETLAIALPEIVLLRDWLRINIERVDFREDGGFCVHYAGVIHDYAHPLLPPVVSERKGYPQEDLPKQERPVPPMTGPNARLLLDGDEWYELTCEVGHDDLRPDRRFPDGRHRHTRVRAFNGDTNILLRDSLPDAWNFLANIDGTLVATGFRRHEILEEPYPVASIHLDQDTQLVDATLVGNGRRVTNGALVECRLEGGGPGFLWIWSGGGSSNSMKKFPLYGELCNIVQVNERTLRGWHAEGRTLFLTRYDRD